MALPIFPYYPQVGPVQRPPQLVGIAQHDGEAEDTSAVSTFTTFSPAPRRQPSLLYDIAMDTSVPACCENHCGLPVPLLANGSYNGHGRTRVDFKVSGSPRCGIQVSKVLRRDLEGLIGRDDIIVLNPESNSVRLKVEWQGYEVFRAKIITPTDKFKVEDLVRKVCAQIEKFVTKDNVHVGDGPAPKWVVGQGGIGVDHLVLVAVKRISTGSWVPCIRLASHIGPGPQLH